MIINATLRKSQWFGYHFISTQEPQFKEDISVSQQAITNHRTLVELVILVHFFCLLVSANVYGQRDFPGKSLDRNQGIQVTLILKFDMRWCEMGMHGIQQCLRDIDCCCIHGNIVSKVKALSYWQKRRLLSHFSSSWSPLGEPSPGKSIWLQAFVC